MKKKKIILVIGGHDPTGGAGIIADIETAGHYKFHALSILSCTTIQSTSKMNKVNPMPKNYIYQSFQEIIKEFKIDVIKIGLLPSIQSSKEVFKILNNSKIKGVPIILDPIIKTGSNTRVTNHNNLKFLVKNIYPKVQIITPNIYEYNIIKNISNNFKEKNIKNILITDYEIKKKHIKLRLKDNIKEQSSYYQINKYSKNYHGTGCTFSTALACNIGLKRTYDESIKIAISFMKDAIKTSCISGKKQLFLNRKL